MARYYAGSHRSPYAKEVTPAGDDIAPGRAVGETTLGSAVDELHAQHPHTSIAHRDDRGPYHYDDAHCRHTPVTSGLYRGKYARGK